MPIAIESEWQQLAIYGIGAALLLTLLFNLPYVGRAVRGLFSFALLAFCLFTLFQQAPYHPTLARLADRFGLDRQQVSGDEVRIPMSPDGHFWARVRINGIERRMLVDSGATMTTLSGETATAAAVERSAGLVPVLMRTANGTVRAETGTVQRLRLGSIEARDLKVIVAPSLVSLDVVGMNFLSRLASWRVEGDTLFLVPRQPGRSRGDEPPAADRDSAAGTG